VTNHCYLIDERRGGLWFGIEYLNAAKLGGTGRMMRPMCSVLRIQEFITNAEGLEQRTAEVVIIEYGIMCIVVSHYTTEYFPLCPFRGMDNHTQL
jgi:hypothetical protein